MPSTVLGYINPDQTKMQRENSKVMRAELKRRRDKGENVVSSQARKNCSQINPDAKFSVKSQILLSNVQSLGPKIDEFRLLLCTLQPDLACLTETWLTSDIDSAMIQVDGYCCVRSDRLNKRSGGTAIYIRNGISYRNRGTNEAFKQEAEGIVLELTTAKLAVICVYIPPSLSAGSLESIGDHIVTIYEHISGFDGHLSKHSNNRIIIVGDFNHFKVDRLTSNLDLVDLVQRPTRGSYTLDHILIGRISLMFTNYMTSPITHLSGRLTT